MLAMDDDDTEELARRAALDAELEHAMDCADRRYAETGSHEAAVETFNTIRVSQRRWRT